MLEYPRSEAIELLERQESLPTNDANEKPLQLRRSTSDAMSPELAVCSCCLVTSTYPFLQRLLAAL